MIHKEAWYREAFRNQGLPYYSDCVGWPENQMAALYYLIDEGKPITMRTFARNIGLESWRDIREQLGYDRYLPISKDWHVGYRKVPGFNIYYLIWSGIEVVFAEYEEIERLLEHAEAQER